MKKSIYVTIGLVSFVTMLFELLQTRILSFIFWNDVVYLAVSMALLGFGISGSLVSLLSAKIKDRQKLISRLLALYATTMIFALVGTGALPYLWLPNRFKLISFEVTIIIQLLVCYVLYLLPFICAGAIISIILSSTEWKVAKLYAVDLLTAGLACLLFFWLLPTFGPERLIGLMSASMAIMSIILRGTKDLRRQKITIVVAATGLFIACFNFVNIVTQPYKDWFRMNFDAKLMATIEKSIWTPLCRIDVVGDETHTLPYFGSLYPPHSFKIILQEGSALTRILSKEAINKTFQIIKTDDPIIDLSMFVWFATKQPDAMIIGTGGGVDVIHALAFGAKSIVGAELNPATFSLARHDYADYSGHILDNQKVTLVNSEGRSALRSLSHKVDIVFLNAIDTFAALSAGAYVLSENYLYTVESMQEMMAHLNTNGLIAFSRWNTNPPRESLRLSSLFCETLRRAGCQTIEKQIFVVAQPCGEGGRLFSKNTDFGWAVSLFKHDPFTKEEVQRLISEAGRHGLRILYLPKVYEQKEQAQIESGYLEANKSDPDFAENSACFNKLIVAYARGEQEKFFANYPYQVTPTTDDSPFFFEYPHKNNLGLPDFRELKRTSAGMAICVVIVESIIFSLLAIFWPLWKYQKAGFGVRSSPQFSVYFSAVGVGFMLIEIGLVQKFVLFLGSPLYALSIVLASLLLSAGLGSAVLSLTNWSWRKTAAVFGGSLVVLLLALVFGLNNLFYSLLYLDLPIKMAIAFLVIFPVGFLMGTFFPSGLEAIKKSNPNYVPWAWGINGCTSVFGSIAAIALAMSQGFTASLLVGVLAYLIACLSAYTIPKQSDSSVG